MFDPKGYREDCARLALGQEKIEEMIQMTENQNKKSFRRPLRVALIAAAAIALLTVTAFAAVPAVQQLFTTYTVTIHSGDSIETAITIPSMTLTDRDGRTILTVDGQEIDVTDAFAKDGEYSFEHEGATITVDAEGWVDTRTADGDPISYSFNLYGKDAAGGDDAPAEEAELPHPNADEVQEQYTVLPGPNGEMNIYDGHGNLVDTDLPSATDVPAE